MLMSSGSVGATAGGASANNAKSLGGFDLEDQVVGVGGASDAAAAAGGVAVKFISPVVGHGLFATGSFTANSLVLEDRPMACVQFAWNKLYKYRACQFCLAPLETSEENVRRLTQNPEVSLNFMSECCPVNPLNHVICPIQPCQWTYCSQQCMEMDSRSHSLLYHQYGGGGGEGKSPMEKLEELWRTLHYPPETFNVLLLAKLLLQAALDGPAGGRLLQMLEGSPGGKSEEIVMRTALGESHAQETERLRMILLEIFKVVIGGLDQPANQQQLQFLVDRCLSSTDKFRSYFVGVTRNVQGVGTSPFAFYVRRLEQLLKGEGEGEEQQRAAANLAFIDLLYEQMEEVVGGFLDNEGVGLYPLQSFANHSCDPNTEVVFPSNDHTLGLRAKRAISPGEQLTISYLDVCDLRKGREKRRMFLRKHYLFECECDRCSQPEEVDAEAGENSSSETGSDSEGEEDGWGNPDDNNGDVSMD